MLNYSLNHNFRIHVYYCIHTIISNLVLFGEWFWLIHTTLLSPTAPLHHLWNSTGPIDRLCPTGCPQHHLANQPQIIGTEWLRTQPGKDLRRVGEVYAAVPSLDYIGQLVSTAMVFNEGFSIALFDWSSTSFKNGIWGAYASAHQRV